MILTTIIIFFIALLVAFGMLTFRAWEIRTGRVDTDIPVQNISLRQVEKNMLYLTKHVVQGIILVGAKYWFIGTTKTKQAVEKNLPKVHALFQKKPQESVPTKLTFVQRSILESKAKIRRIKEKVKKEHQEKLEEKIESTEKEAE